MKTHVKMYNEYTPIMNRRKISEEKLSEIREEFLRDDFFSQKKLSLFAAGSLGRLEYGDKSDLDLFIISQESIRRLDEIRIFSILMNINEKFEFPEFSNDGKYLKIYDLGRLKTAIGSPKDDEENLFTARMLLILESQPLCNETLYRQYLTEIVSEYYRDKVGAQNFRPLFLLNDILRFWRTLCLNYEEIRHDKNRPWRKKNINLKFSRMLTVFATVLPLIAKPMKCDTDFLELCQKSPLERLSYGLDILYSNEFRDNYHDFLEHYEDFLRAKENEEIEINTNLKHELDLKAVEFSDFLHQALSNEKIEREYRKCLMI